MRLEYVCLIYWSSNPLTYVRYEIELAFRKGVERDTVCIRKEIDELTLWRSNLEMEYESLREERINLEKTYEEV